MNSAVMKEPVNTLADKKIELSRLRKEVTAIAGRLSKAQEWLASRPDIQLTELRSQIKDAKNILQDNVIINETSEKPTKTETSRLEVARATLNDLQADFKSLQDKVAQMADSVPRLTNELADANRKKAALIRNLRNLIAKAEMETFGPQFMRELARFHITYCHSIPMPSGARSLGEIVDLSRGNYSNFNIVAQETYDDFLHQAIAEFDKSNGLEK